MELKEIVVQNLKSIIRNIENGLYKDETLELLHETVADVIEETVDERDRLNKTTIQYLLRGWWLTMALGQDDDAQKTCPACFKEIEEF